MADWPFVSIIVPVFNGAETIDALLQSLMALDYPSERYEIIVVDNNSNDDTPQHVRQYPVKLLYERELQSSYAARNRGVKAAKGEFIAFTDADCVAHRDWLRHLLAGSKNSQWAGFAGGIEAYPPRTIVQRHLSNSGWLTLSFHQASSPRIPQAKGEKLCSRFGFLNYRADIRLPDNLLNPPTANVVYRREVYDKIGYFDASLTSGGDLDFAWRLQTQTDWQIKVVPEAIIYHQHRPDLASMNQLYRKNGRGNAMLALKYGTNPQRMARQIYLESILLICFSLANQSLNLSMRVWHSLFHRPLDDLYLKTPLFHAFGSLNFYYGRLIGARKVVEALSKNLSSTVIPSSESNSR